MNVNQYIDLELVLQSGYVFCVFVIPRRRSPNSKHAPCGLICRNWKHAPSTEHDSQDPPTMMTYFVPTPTLVPPPVVPVPQVEEDQNSFRSMKEAREGGGRPAKHDARASLCVALRRAFMQKHRVMLTLAEAVSIVNQMPGGAEKPMNISTLRKRAPKVAGSDLPWGKLGTVEDPLANVLIDDPEILDAVQKTVDAVQGFARHDTGGLSMLALAAEDIVQDPDPEPELSMYRVRLAMLRDFMLQRGPEREAVPDPFSKDPTERFLGQWLADLGEYDEEVQEVCPNWQRAGRVKSEYVVAVAAFDDVCLDNEDSMVGAIQNLHKVPGLTLCDVVDLSLLWINGKVAQQTKRLLFAFVKNNVSEPHSIAYIVKSIIEM